MKRLCVVIPAYGKYAYVAQAVNSLLMSGPNVHALVVDDCSPNRAEASQFLEVLSWRFRGQFDALVHSENLGLTMSWNDGIEWALDRDFTYICVTNSDVYFPRNWFEPLQSALTHNLHLVGPVTNAPGSEPGQAAGQYSKVYSDVKFLENGLATPDRIQAVADDLMSSPTNPDYVLGPINGFCMVAEAKNWADHSFRPGEAFKPVNHVNSRGEPNPTPTMTLQEYELQGRWRERGLRIGYCPKSYVFHYRAVTRGDRYRAGDWYRLPEGQ